MRRITCAAFFPVMHLAFPQSNFTFSLAAFLVASLSAAVPNESPVTTSTPMAEHTFFDWNALPPKPTPVGLRRDVFDAPTATFARFESHISTLRPGLASHAPHQHPQEEIIILKEGSLIVHLNGREVPLDTGGIAFFAANDWHAVRNAGANPATYWVINVATAATAAAPKTPAAESAAPEKLRSGVFRWDSLNAQPTPRGARRDIVNASTVTFHDLSLHATTLNAGETPHAPHRHADEEIIVVKEGTLEATVDGTTRSCSAGSLFFFASNQLHGLKNIGSMPATYYVLRIVAKKPEPSS